MKRSNNKFDFEHKGRIDEISKSLSKNKKILITDAISNSTIASKFYNNKSIIHHFDRDKILISFPFNEEIYVTFCRNCIFRTSLEELKKFLEYHAFVPILTSSYAEYPEPFQNLFIQYPHISAYEFYFLRTQSLFAIATSGLCPHCVKRMKDEFKKTANQFIRGSNSVINTLFNNLYPYYNPDDELLYEFEKGLAKKDLTYLQQIYDLSESVWYERSSQVLNGRTLFQSSSLSMLTKRASIIIPSITKADVGLIESALAQNISIDIPIGTEISNYFKAIDPYRKDLTKIVESILEDSNKLSGLPSISINNSLSELNLQLNKINRNKRYLSYQAVLGFAKNNKLLLGSILIASIFGLIPGCGALTATMAVKLAIKSGKINMPSEAIPLVSEIKHSIRPHLSKLIAKYTCIDDRAIQLFEIKRSLQNDLKRNH
jgi:hypothetical protein